MTVDRWLGVVGAIGTVFGIVGCILAWYFFRRSEKSRIPTFVAHPHRRVLVQPALGRLREFSVLHQNRRVGENGITEVLIYFWNSGTLPVLHSEVLKQFTIRIHAEILHYSISKLSRDIVNLQASCSDEVPREKLILSFGVLEPGDGATIQIIYDGFPDVQVEFDGACVGAAKPTVLPADPIYFTTRPRRLLSMFEPLIGATVFGLTFSVVFSGLVWIVKRLFGEVVLGIAFFVLLGAGTLAALAAMLWVSYRKVAAKYIPPDIRS